MNDTAHAPRAMSWRTAPRTTPRRNAAARNRTMTMSASSSNASFHVARERFRHRSNGRIDRRVADRLIWRLESQPVGEADFGLLERRALVPVEERQGVEEWA